MTPALHRLDDRELFDWLRLIRSENVGPRTFRALLGQFGSARAALEALPALARRSGGRRVVLAAVRDVDSELDAARRAGLVLLPLCDPAYPPSLRVIDAPPPILAVRGQLDVLQRPMVAMVGSRNASAVGLVMTERLARGLGEAGFVIVSGLARGIDASAHRAGLATGTVGVLAGGHDRIYPSEHVRLVEQMAAAGAVVSEMPIGWEPRGRDFPRRNRIVSGLSLGVVVVEAARRSGSLITARFANEQGREVLAVPGSPVDPRAEGTNDLLRQGATLCTCAEHAIEAIGPMVQTGPRFAAREPAPGDELYWDELDAAGTVPSRQDDLFARREDMADDRDEPAAAPDEATMRRRVADLIGPAPITVDELVRVSAAPASMVQGVLIELEVEGHVIRHGANAVSRVPV